MCKIQFTFHYLQHYSKEHTNWKHTHTKEMSSHLKFGLSSGCCLFSIWLFEVPFLSPSNCLQCRGDWTYWNRALGVYFDCSTDFVKKVWLSIVEKDKRQTSQNKKNYKMDQKTSDHIASINNRGFYQGSQEHFLSYMVSSLSTKACCVVILAGHVDSLQSMSVK